METRLSRYQGAIDRLRAEGKTEMAAWPTDMVGRKTDIAEWQVDTARRELRLLPVVAGVYSPAVAILVSLIRLP